MRLFKTFGLAFIFSVLLCGLPLKRIPLALSAETPLADTVNKSHFSGGELHHQIRTLLSSMAQFTGEAKEPLPANLTDVIIVNQPASGNFLLSLIARPNDKLRRRAINAFVETWATMNVQQIDGYIHRAIELKIDHRERYPQRSGAVIAVEYSSVDGWGGWPSNDTSNFKTRTSSFVDGKPYGSPFSYQGSMAFMGGIYINGLSLGKHTAQLLFKYEFTHQGIEYKGSFKSKKTRFDIVKDTGRDELKAPVSTELEARVKAAFHVADTQKELISQLPPGLSFGATISDGPDGTEPQNILYDRSSGMQVTTHCPYWGIAPGLPVDMIFDVTIQDLTTGKTCMGESIEVPKNTKTLGMFEPYWPDEFANGRTGTFPIKVTLKPSRSRALTSRWITQYYPETLTFDGLKIQVNTRPLKKPENNK